MKTHNSIYRVIRAVTRGFVVSVVLSTAFAQTNEPVFVKHQPMGDYFALAFWPNTDQWISIERSSDLLHWGVVASMATTNKVTEFLDEKTAGDGLTFYRLRRPGASVEEMESRWLPLAGKSYRYEMQCVRSSLEPQVLSATVTISGGVKKLTNIQADGQALESIDPGNFPTIQELFEALRQAQRAGCWNAMAIYDGTNGFPLKCSIERMTAAEPIPVKRSEVYRITNFTFLESSTH